LIRDIGTFAGMLEARHGGEHQLVHHCWIIERERAWKDAVTNNAVCSCYAGRDEHQRT
jgi:hypothetical protein